MTPTTMSSREFNQDTGRAKRAAAQGPVFITDRGRPAHVLLSIDDYRRIAGDGDGANVVEALGQPSGIEDVEIDFPESREPVRPVDLG